MLKNTLRKRILAYRKKNYKSINLKFYLLKNILKRYKFLKNKNIGLYFPINYEIDCLGILNQLERYGNKISLPATREGNKMDFFEWSSQDPLLIGKIGIPEPTSRIKTYPDVLLLPVVAFNKNKFRLGYGGGYYDRYIEKIKKIKKILTIGIAFSFQEVKRLPIYKHDKKLDYIFTENYIK